MSNINNQESSFKACKDNIKELQLIEELDLAIKELSLITKTPKSCITNYVRSIRTKINLSKTKLTENANELLKKVGPI